MDAIAYKTKLVDAWKQLSVTTSRRAVSDTLTLGRIAQSAIDSALKGMKDPGARRTARAICIDDLVEGLTGAGCERSKELNRWIGVNAVAECFGKEDAATLPLSTLRAFIPLIRREAKYETWAIRRKHIDFSQSLWTAAPTMLLRNIVAAIQVELGKDRHKPERTTKPALSRAEKIRADIETLTLDEQRHLLEVLRVKLAIRPAPETAPGWLSAIGLKKSA